MSRADAYIFAVQENRVASVRVQLSQFGSLPDRGLLHRLERVRRGRPTLYPLGFPEPHYILPCTACAVTHRTNLGFANLVPCVATVVYSIPCAGVHRRTGQQVSGTARPCDPVRERANKVFGKRSARLLSSSSSRLDFLDDLRVRGRLVSNVVFFELLLSPLKLLPSLLQRLLHLQLFGTFVTFRWLCS